jgi:hypothetical protein
LVNFVCSVSRFISHFTGTLLTHLSWIISNTLVVDPYSTNSKELNGNQNGSWNSIQRNVMYSPSPKSEVHLSTITLYMDISSNMIHQQNTWDVPFHQTSNGVNV